MDNIPIITESPIFSDDVVNRFNHLVEDRKKMAIVETFPLMDAIIERPDRINAITLIWKIIKLSPNIIKLVLKIYDITEGIKMFKDPKTTIASIVQAVVIVLSIIGINISPNDTQTIITVAGGIYALVGIIKGWFTKDKEITNG